MEIGTSQFNAINSLNDSYLSVRDRAAKIASKESLDGMTNKEKDLIEMKQSESNFSAIAKVLKTENDMMGIFLDEKV
ncbi:MAG: hypothetical protein QM479_12905 [Pseudomonadota bacterium]